MRFSLARTRAVAIAVAGAIAAPTAHASDTVEPARIDTSRFDQLDRNRDGVITQDEVRHIRDYARPFLEADQNKDGKLDRDEFIKAESIYDRIRLGKYFEDSVLTAKVKAALLKVPELKSLAISVETERGEVLLSGFVRDESQRLQAMKAANSVEGVASVKNAMLVR
jgi:hyperosmotically inducible protein